MGLQDCYCELLILKTAVRSVLPSPNHNIRHTVGRAVEPGSIKLNALPCVWFPTLGRELSGGFPSRAKPANAVITCGGCSLPEIHRLGWRRRHAG